jgi:hypothetical protein
MRAMSAKQPRGLVWFCGAISFATFACGHGSKGFDAGAPDLEVADASATPMDLTPSFDEGDGLIHVTLTRGTVPVPGAAVVSHDSTGAPIATFTTDASGEVGIPNAGVDMVTVIDDGAAQLYTAFGVKPGDHIVIPSYAIINNLGTVSVTLTAEPNAVYYSVLIGTDAASATVTTAAVPVMVTSSDVGADGNVNVIAFARDADYNMLGFATATVAAPALGVTTPVSTGAWNANLSQFELMVSGGAGIGDIENTTSGQAIDGVDFAPPTRSTTSYLYWNTVPALGGYVEYSGQFPYAAVMGSSRFYAKRLAASATTDTIVESQLLPGLLATTANTTDIARPTLTWAASASVTTADGVILNTQYQQGQWAFMVPTSQTSVRFPELPAALSSWTPTATVSMPYAVVIDTSYDAGYGDFRNDGFGLVSGPAFLHPGVGTLSGSVYFP